MITKAFIHNSNAYNIKIYGDNENPLFLGKEIADIIGISKIAVMIKNYTQTEVQKFRPDDDTRVRIFLTKYGIKRFLGSSTKELAPPLFEWIKSFVKYETIDTNFIVPDDSDKSDHEKLVKQNANKRIVYVMRMTDYNKDGICIIKLGYTKNIVNRVSKNAYDFYGTAILIHAQECFYNESFETYLLEHEKIHEKKYEVKKKSGTMSTETFAMTKDNWRSMIEIIKADYNKFENADLIEKDALIDKLKNIIISQNKFINDKINEIIADIDDKNISDKLTEINQIIHKTDISVENIDKEEEEIDEPIENKIADGFSELLPNIRGKVVQQYNPINNKLIMTYAGVEQVKKYNADFSTQCVTDAMKNNTIYKNYRWFGITKTQEIKEYDIPATKEPKRIYKKKFKIIAMMTSTKTEILAHFYTMKDAMLHFGITTCNDNLRKAIESNTIFKNHRWAEYEECSEELRNKYEEIHGKVEYKNNIVNAKKVHKIDPDTWKIVNTFDSLEQVKDHLSSSINTVKKKIKDKEVFKGFIWEFQD